MATDPSASAKDTLDAFARLDTARARRSGIPEVVYGESKTPGQIVAICRELVEKTGRAIATRLRPEASRALEDLSASFFADRTLAVVGDPLPSDEVAQNWPLVAVLAAGTSDLPVAEEAVVLARAMNCRTRLFVDVGVAGLHRLVEPVRAIIEEKASIVVAVAGMEGALPTVLKGLIPTAVIGVPTSVGYGFGRPGESALMTMLNSCAPGLTVVNIDNGVGAGATAALIARGGLSAQTT